jgi:hypothetical protein
MEARMMIKNQIFKFVNTARRRIRSGAGGKKSKVLLRVIDQAVA